MQRPDESKRREILQTAARLFGTRPYHEVRLEDIAAAARVGKGTLYIYFQSKESLYMVLIREGFERIVATIRADLATSGEGVWDRLERVAGGLIEFATSFPDLYRVMRGGTLTPEDPELQRTRRELTDLIEGIIREGNDSGELDDPHPAITAQFLLSFVRGALLYPPPGLTPDGLREHAVRVLRGGIAAGVRA